MPVNAQDILELPHWLSESVSFIDCVVSRTITTLYGLLNPPLPLAVAVAEIGHELTPNTRAKVVPTVACSRTTTAFAPAGDSEHGIPMLVRHFT